LLKRGPDVVRAPDVWFVRADRVPADGIPVSFWPGAPDLAIEVLSPTDRVGAVLRKVREYLDAGVRLVWVIDPEARTAGVFRPGRTEHFIDDDRILDGEDVLPGFTLPLREVLP
jgi:Uma2 family endonuclease